MDRNLKLSLRFLLALALLSVPSIVLVAQDRTDSLFYMQQQLRANAWQSSGNAIFLKDAGLANFAEAGLFYEQEKGNFKRAQDHLRQQHTGIKASGITSYNDWRFNGNFSYLKLFRDSVKYANTARPLSGNPFTTADLKGGNWKGDQIKANLDLLAPALGRWSMALTLCYEAEQSARTNEPKPLYRFMNYRIMPAVGYQLNPHSKISFTAGINGTDEVIETGLYSRENAILYDLRGYGTAVPTTIVRSERFVSGSGWETGFDYQLRSGRGNLIVGGRYGRRVEEVNEGVQKSAPSLPLLVGSLDETHGKIYLGYQHEHRKGWQASAVAWFRDGLGYDGYFKTINPTYYLSGLDGKFSWYSLNRRGYQVVIQFAPGINYMNYAESAAKTDWLSLMAYTKISTAIHYRLSSKFRLAAEPLIGYCKNLQNDLVINNPSIISELVVRPDFAFNTADFFIANASLMGTLDYKNTLYRLSIAYGTTVPAEKMGRITNNRNQLKTSISILF